MKKIYTRCLVICTICLGFTGIVQGQIFKPLGPAAYTSSAPKYYPYDTSVNPGFAVYKGICYFAATVDPQHIKQLWRSDGTTAGTYAVTLPGSANLNLVYDIEVIDDKLYALGTILCIIDDTAQSAIPTLVETASGSSPTNIITLNGLKYYARDGALLSTDGTKSFSLNPSSSGGSPSAHLTLVKNAIVVNFFKIYQPNTTAYISDGTKAGSVPLDISINDRQLTALGDSFYFVHGDSLYTNPSSPEAGSSKLANNPLGVTLAKAYINKPIPVLNGDLYFAATTALTGMELFKYSPYIGAITLVKDVLPGPASAGIDFNTLVKAGNSLFFSCTGADGNMQLWKSDGIGTGTVLVKSFDDSAYAFSNFTDVNGELYFSCSNKTYGNELWKSDGTEAGTVLVKDIEPGIYNADPGYITPGINQAFFMANDGVHGSELWKTDGTEAGTLLVKDVNTAAPFEPVSMQYFTKFNNLLLFNATDEIYGTELWATDGTPAGTGLVKDIAPGITSSNPSFLTAANNGIYFLTDSAAGLHKVWKTDGTPAGTTLVKSFDDYSIQPFYITGAANNLGFFLLSNNNNKELWRTDGTDIGTFKITDVANSTTVDNILFSAVGNIGYFINGTDLWKTDGTEEGTVMEHHFLFMPSQLCVLNNTLVIFSYEGLWILNSSGFNLAVAGNYEDSAPMQVINNRLFFYNIRYIEDETYTDYYLNAIDTTGSIQSIHDFTIYPPQEFILSGGKIFFVNWKDKKLGVLNDTTGTITYLTKNFPWGNMLDFNGKLYFMTNENPNPFCYLGYSDGTYQGTQLIPDAVAPFFTPTKMMVINNNLVFVAKPSTFTSLLLYGYEIEGGALPVTLSSFTAKLQNGNGLLSWNTATEQNSNYFAVQRSTDGLHFSSIGKVAATGNSTYTQDYSYTDYKLSQYGAGKLYYRLQQFGKDGKFTYSKIVALNINTQFTASISPIPLANRLNVNITSAKRQTVLISVVDMWGKTVASFTKPIEAGSTTLTYSAAGWAKGIYQVHITQANGNKQTISVVR